MLDAQWRIEETATYICERGFTEVTLQFPDDSLSYAARVSNAVQAACQQRGHVMQAYVLADTTYNSLSVDEVAAAHVGAQCVIHYGRASLTKLSRLPAFFVFPQACLDVPSVAACLASSALLSLGSASNGCGGAGSPVLVFLDQPFLQQLQQLAAALTQLVQQRHGQAAAERLIFPAVPRQSMEPETGTTVTVAAAECEQQPQETTQLEEQRGCCGGGSCGSMPQQGSYPPKSSARAGAEAAAELCSSNSCGDGEGDGGEDGRLHTLGGYQWRLPAGVQPRQCGLAWVGAPDAPALLQLQLTFSACQWALLDPALLPPVAAADAGSMVSAAAAPAFLDGAVGGGGASPSTSLPADSAGAAADASWGGALREGLPLDISRTLRRRYYLVQRARDARVVGILVGTLGAAGYADAVARLRAAAAAAGKKTYTLLVGKPSPAKLANFPEIEVFVLVADPQGQILDCKDYLAPIVTPHEAMLAFEPSGEGGEPEWDEAQYRLDFEGVLQQQGGGHRPLQQQQDQRQGVAGVAAGARGRFSLLAGGYTGGEDDGSGSGSDAEEGQQGSDNGGGVLALHAQQALQVSAAPLGRSDLAVVRSAADYLVHRRTWQGVEAPLVGAAPAPVVAAAQGRSGRAAGYVDEPRRRQQ